MKKPKVFLTAHWHHLVSVNYVVEPHLLEPYLPYGTILDSHNGLHYVSLVAFKYDDTKLRGVPVPWHTSFEEINLRFYVKRLLPDGTWRSGVAFTQLFFPKRTLKWIANSVYKENYLARKMRSNILFDNNVLVAEYELKWDDWHGVFVSADATSRPFKPKSIEAFFNEHLYGYAQVKKTKSTEYKIKHPPWEIYPVKESTISLDFEKLFGKSFGCLNNQEPTSVLLSKGSYVSVLSLNYIKAP